MRMRINWKFEPRGRFQAAPGPSWRQTVHPKSEPHKKAQYILKGTVHHIFNNFLITCTCIGIWGGDLKGGDRRQGEWVDMIKNLRFWNPSIIKVPSNFSRTPMKRLSYMHDYATPEGTVIRVHPVVHSPRLLQSLKRFDSVKKTTSAAPLSARKQTPYNVGISQNKVKIGRDGGLYRENRENVHPSVKPVSKAQLHSFSTTKPSRRYPMHIHTTLNNWLLGKG